MAGSRQAISTEFDRPALRHRLDAGLAAMGVDIDAALDDAGRDR